MKTFLLCAAATVYCSCLLEEAQAWSPNPFSNMFSSSNPSSSYQRINFDEDNADVDADGKKKQQEQVQETRRRFLNAAAMNICFLGAAATPAAIAADSTKYISGKTPVAPGQKPPDKSNTKGTRKDPDFLRSIADCRSQCQNSSSGPDGFAKAKEDCLSECQDICCKTYEQCTFNIVPRI